MQPLTIRASQQSVCPVRSQPPSLVSLLYTVCVVWMLVCLCKSLRWPDVDVRFSLLLSTLHFERGSLTESTATHLGGLAGVPPDSSSIAAGLQEYILTP